MLKENKELISVRKYADDCGKSQQSINRFLLAGRDLPGIIEYYKLDKSGYVLKKGSDYKSIVSKIKKQKYIYA